MFDRKFDLINMKKYIVKKSYTLLEIKMYFVRNMFDQKFDLLKCPRVRGLRGEAVVNRENWHLMGKLYLMKNKNLYENM